MSLMNTFDQFIDQISIYKRETNGQNTSSIEKIDIRIMFYLGFHRFQCLIIMLELEYFLSNVNHSSTDP